MFERKRRGEEDIDEVLAWTLCADGVLGGASTGASKSR